MAQQHVTDAGTLIIPGAYPEVRVQAGNAGLATTRVLMLVGEADAGPDYSKEDNLALNAFGPQQLAAVRAKYKSGPLVDAYIAAQAPANDPAIAGSFSRVILVKTNPSTKASGTLTKIGGGTYETLADKSWGKLGNLLTYKVESKTAEVVPTTGSFTWIPTVGTVDWELRVNGGAAQAATQVAANDAPSAIPGKLSGVTGVTASGGTLRTVIPSVTGNLTVTLTSGVTNGITITYTGTWNTTPSVGDTLVIPTASPIDGGAGDDNVGGYVVTEATTNTIKAVKLSDAGKSGAVAGTVTAPVAVSSTAVTATTNFGVYAPVVIAVSAADAIDGKGKSLEIAELTTGTDRLNRAAYALSTTKVTWVSQDGAAKVLTSAAEYAVKLTVARNADSLSEEITAGGDVALTLGYDGTTGQVVIDETDLVATVTGGSGAGFTVALKDFVTLNDLVEYINTQTGWTAAVGTATLGSVASTALDRGTFTCGTTHGAKTGRIKIDAFRFAARVNASNLVQLGTDNDDPQRADAGLPATASLKFMTGGARGATSDTNVSGAIDALEQVQGNFLVTLFSRDATEDVADGLTDSGSTYTIDSINAKAKSHVLAMSTLKRRRNRQAFVSKRGTFTVAKTSAANLASHRAAMTFQDFKNVGNAGSLVQFHPWMGAVVAAAMQAAGFYRAIFGKGVNVSGVLQAAADFKDNDDSQVEDALLAGLLVAKQNEEGGFEWVSDQTTYSKDTNFVFNSIQAVYAADVIALTTARRMEKAFKGQSVADISAALAVAFLEKVLDEFRRLKLIASSDDAAKGYRNIKITISGGVMQVEVEVKLAGAIYFIPIVFLVSPVTQTAGA